MPLHSTCSSHQIATRGKSTLEPITSRCLLLHGALDHAQKPQLCKGTTATKHKHTSANTSSANKNTRTRMTHIGTQEGKLWKRSIVNFIRRKEASISPYQGKTTRQRMNIRHRSECTRIPTRPCGKMEVALVGLEGKEGDKLGYPCRSHRVAPTQDDTARWATTFKSSASAKHVRDNLQGGAATNSNLASSIHIRHRARFSRPRPSRRWMPSATTEVTLREHAEQRRLASAYPSSAFRLALNT